MVGTAVAVAGKKANAVAVAYDPKKFDYAAASKRAEKFAGAVGASLGGKRNFPGEKYVFSLGDWYFGYKAKQNKKPLTEDPVLVVNVLQAGACWVKWVDKKPTFTDVRLLDGSNGDLELREDLGDTDPEEWDTDPRNGSPIDPWKPVLVFPVRDEDGDTINHIDLSTKSSAVAGYGLFREVMQDMAMHTGELPLVELSSRKVEIKRKVKDKKGKEKDVTDVFDAPVFKVVGWTEMKACDVPNGEVQAALSDEVGEVESRERAPEKAEAKSKPAAKGGKRKAQVIDDEDSI